MQEEFRLARHHKGRIILKAKRKEFRLSQKEMCESPDTMWKAYRYVRNIAPRQAYLPRLNQNLDPLSAPDLANSPQTKAKLLQTSFFPLPPEPNLSDIPGYIYPTPTPMPLITQREIGKAIFKPAEDQALGDNNIPNWIL